MPVTSSEDPMPPLVGISDAAAFVRHLQLSSQVRIRGRRGPSGGRNVQTTGNQHERLLDTRLCCREVLKFVAGVVLCACLGEKNEEEDDEEERGGPCSLKPFGHFVAAGARLACRMNWSEQRCRHGRFPRGASCKAKSQRKERSNQTAVLCWSLF